MRGEGRDHIQRATSLHSLLPLPVSLSLLYQDPHHVGGCDRSCGSTPLFAPCPALPWSPSIHLLSDLGEEGVDDDDSNVLSESVHTSTVKFYHPTEESITA